MNSAIEIIDLEQNTPEWLAFRQNHIGASDSPIIMEKNPWTTPYQLWQMKLGLRSMPEENDAMKRGKEKESIAREEFASQTGIFVKPMVVKNREHSFMIASMDGLSIDQSKAVEIKVPGRIDHECAMDGVIPEKYIPQLMHQMIVCDIQSIFYFSWNETSSKILELSRDSNLEKAIIEKETEFWDCVQNFKEPKLTERDYIQRNDAEWMEATNQWKSVKDKLKQLEEQEEAARKWLLEISQNQCCQGNGVKLTKFVRRGNIEYNKVPELIGRNLEPYRKPPIVSWRVS